MAQVFASSGKDMRGRLPRLLAPLSDHLSSWQSMTKAGELGQGGRFAAVAVLLIPPPGVDAARAEQSCRLVLTRRSIKVGTHKGQIAFAGGRRDADDESPAETACREVQEEIGLSCEALTVHGLLPMVRSIDGSWVYPLLMTAAVTEDDFKLNSAEVSELILSPWTHFSCEKQKSFAFTMFGKRRQSYLYDTGAHQVWGLTAQIIAEAGFH